MKQTFFGLVPPASGKADLKGKDKKRRYKKPNGEIFEITEDEFNQVVEIFDYMRKIRDRIKNTQLETLEPENQGHEVLNDVERVG